MSVIIPSLRAAVAVPGWAKNELWRKAVAPPSLDLRFADSKSLVDATTGSNLVTFTRASSGTFVDSAGVLQTAVTDAPRFDHNPTTGESLGLLVEEQRANLLQRSEEFDNAGTIKINATVTANAIASPAGTLTADKMVENTAASVAHIVANELATVVSGTVYTLSVFCKAAERSWVFMLGSGAPFGSNGIYVNLSTGATGSSLGSPGSVVVTPFGNGWYRISFSLTAGSSAAAGLQVRTATGDNGGVYTGDGTSGIFLWGAQLEAGAFPTSYIPTTTTAVTRSADVASISGSNFSAFYRQDQGTVFWEGSRTRTTGFPERFNLNDGTVNNRIFSYWDAGANSSTFNVTSGSVDQGSIFGAGSALLSTAKSAFGLATNNTTAVYSGTIQGTDTTVTLPTVSQLTIGTSLTGTIRRLTYWPTRLPNSTLQAVTQ